MINIKPARLVYQHENPDRADKIIKHVPGSGSEKNYAQVGSVKTTVALNAIDSIQKLNRPSDTPEQHEDKNDTLQSSSEEALKEQIKQAGSKPEEYNIARHPLLGIWLAKKKIESGGKDGSEADYKASREDLIKFIILMGGRQIEEYEIQRVPMLGYYSAKRKTSSNQ